MKISWRAATKEDIGRLARFRNSYGNYSYGMLDDIENGSFVCRQVQDKPESDSYFDYCEVQEVSCNERTPLFPP